MTQKRNKCESASVQQQFEKVLCFIDGCHNEDGCEYDFLDVNGGRYHRVSWAGLDYCPFCGVAPGRSHHFSCPFELCPRCDNRVMDKEHCSCNVTAFIKADNIHEAERVGLNNKSRKLSQAEWIIPEDEIT